MPDLSEMPLCEEIEYDYFKHGAADDGVHGTQQLGELLRHPATYMHGAYSGSVIVVRLSTAPPNTPQYIKMNPSNGRASIMLKGTKFGTDEVWEALKEAGLTP